MPLNPFATVVDLELATGEKDERVLKLALDRASGRIRAEARQTISLVEDDEITLPGTWSPELWLPERPVIDVSAVTLNGLTVVAGGFTWSSGGQLYRGILPVGNAPEPDDDTPGVSGWGGSRSAVAVTYSHGFAEIPGDIFDLCLAVAARMLDNTESSETLGEYSYQNNIANAGAALTEDEKATCARFRIDVRSISAGR